MEDFATLLETYFSEKERTYSLGEKVKGYLVHLDEKYGYVDIGTKKEALISREELFDLEGKPLFKKGDEIEALVIKALPEGRYFLSVKKILEEELKRALKEAFERKEAILVKIKEKIKGGFEVIYQGMLQGFLPLSQAVEPSQEEVPVLILRLDEKGFVVSQKAYLEREREKKLKELIAVIEGEGILEGRVKKEVKGGYLVDFEGVLTGFLPYSELTRRRLSSYEGFLKEGDEIRVKVLSWDRVQQKLKVSLKALEPDPWEEAVTKYGPDQRVRGRVVKVMHFGAFVEVEPGLEGLLPASEISWKRGLKPSDILSEGDLVEVVITEFLPEERKMILSLKRLEESPWEKIVKEFKVGDIIEGPVKNVAPFGLFVEVLEGLDGFIPASEVSWERIEDLKSHFRAGEKVRAKILETDPERKRLILSLKALVPNPWEELAKEIKVGDLVEGTVISELKTQKAQGYLVRIREGVVGFLPLKEIYQEEAKGKRTFKEGDRVKGKVILLDPERRKLWISERAYLLEEEKEEFERLAREKGKSSIKLGDLINLKT